MLSNPTDLLKNFKAKYFSNDKSIWESETRTPSPWLIENQKKTKNSPKHFYVVINSTFFCGRFFLKSRITFKPTRKKEKERKNDQSHKKMSRQDKICWMDLKAPSKKRERERIENPKTNSIFYVHEVFWVYLWSNLCSNNEVKLWKLWGFSWINKCWANWSNSYRTMKLIRIRGRKLVSKIESIGFEISKWL